MTERFDGIRPQALRVPKKQLQQASGEIDADLGAAIAEASGRIRSFHAADIPRAKSVETAPGLLCSVHYQPLSPIGLYIPGGSAPLISTILMLAIPAQLARCDEIVLCTRMPAGEIDRGTIDVLLSLPVSRRAVYWSESIVWLITGVLILVMGLIGHRITAPVMPEEMRPELSSVMAWCQRPSICRT